MGTDKRDNAPSTREYRDVDVTDQEWGSDYIADLLKAYGFEFVSFNPGASFRGLEELIVNYNDNIPQVVETPHEGLSAVDRTRVRESNRRCVSSTTSSGRCSGR